MSRPPARPGRGASGRVRDDAGGVWIVTGWVVGLLVYAGVVLMWHAGFTAAAPFVVIPAILVVMVGVGNLLGGRSGRPAPRFRRPDLDPVPVATLHGEPAGPTDGAGAPGPPAAEPGAGR